MKPITPKRRLELKKQLLLWLDMGWPRWRINESSWDIFDADPETVDVLIQEIRHEQKKNLDISKTEFMTQQLTRLEALASKAIEENNLGVALGAFKEMHALIGLHAASR